MGLVVHGCRWEDAPATFQGRAEFKAKDGRFPEECSPPLQQVSRRHGPDGTPDARGVLLAPSQDAAVSAVRYVDEQIVWKQELSNAEKRFYETQALRESTVHGASLLKAWGGTDASKYKKSNADGIDTYTDEQICAAVAGAAAGGTGGIPQTTPNKK